MKIYVSMTIDELLIQDVDYIASVESRSRSSMSELLIRAGILSWEKEHGKLPAYKEEQ